MPMVKTKEKKLHQNQQLKLKKEKEGKKLNRLY
jgi:hypothetical protein